MVHDLESDKQGSGKFNGRKMSVVVNNKNRKPKGKWMSFMLVGLVLVMPSSFAFSAEPLQVRAVLKANAAATISVAISARVLTLPFREGQSFNKGDELLTFSCDRYIADLRAKVAAFKARSLVAKNNTRLLRHQAVGRNELAVSISQMAEAEAVRDGQAALVRQCKIMAPYDGKMVERLINPHEIPAPNQPLFKIIDRSQVDVKLIVPSNWLGWLKPETRFDVRLDETGDVLRAKVTRLGAVVDAVSQTVKVTGALLAPSKKVLPGMSGTATFSYTGS